MGGGFGIRLKPQKSGFGASLVLFIVFYRQIDLYINTKFHRNRARSFSIILLTDQHKITSLMENEKEKLNQHVVSANQSWIQNKAVSLQLQACFPLCFSWFHQMKTIIHNCLHLLSAPMIRFVCETWNILTWGQKWNKRLSTYIRAS